MAQSEGSAVFETVDGVDTQGGHGVLEWLVCRMSRLPSQPAGERPISLGAVRAFDTFDCRLGLLRLEILKLSMFVSSLALYARTRFFLASVLQRYHNPVWSWLRKAARLRHHRIATSARWEEF